MASNTFKIEETGRLAAHFGIRCIKTRSWVSWDRRTAKFSEKKKQKTKKNKKKTRKKEQTKGILVGITEPREIS
jgi:hypothetical protein